jgi:predicted HAD superfamily Cof-like phosphohydrolase
MTTSNSTRKEQIKQTDETIRSHYDLVGEFHDTFGHPSRDTLYEDCFDDPKLVPFRISLIREELNELKDAVNKNDLIEACDALCDLSYVINGAGHCLGINLDKYLQKLNLCIKTPDKLNTTGLVTSNTLEQNSAMIVSGIRELERALFNFGTSYKTQDINEMAEYLAGILWSVYNLGHGLGFNMDQMFREVHRSNMTKVCNNIEDALASVAFYEKDGRYKKPTFKIKNQYFVIYDAETSKILKNHKWESPNLNQFI